jgi:hypothetical protein
MNSRGSSGVAQVMADVIGDLVTRGVWQARSITAETSEQSGTKITG